MDSLHSSIDLPAGSVTHRLLDNEKRLKTSQTLDRTSKEVITSRRAADKDKKAK